MGAYGLDRGFSLRRLFEQVDATTTQVSFFSKVFGSQYMIPDYRCCRACSLSLKKKCTFWGKDKDAQRRC